MGICTVKKYGRYLLAMVGLMAPAVYAAGDSHDDHHHHGEMSTAEDVFEHLDAEVLEPGWGFELEISGSAEYLKEEYNEDEDEDRVYTDEYNLQAEDAFDPSYAFEGAYTQLFFAPSVASSVSFGLEGNFMDLDKLSDDETAPSLELALTPAHYFQADSEVSLDEWGYEGQTFDFGGVSAFFNISAETQIHFEDDLEYASEVSFEHAFDPLGTVSALWGEAEFNGTAVNSFTAEQSLSEISEPASAEFEQLASLALSKYIDGHLISASLNNVIVNGEIPFNKIHDQLFETDEVEVYQYVQLFHYYVPWKLSSELTLNRVPHPEDSDKHLTTHGYSVEYAFAYEL